MFAARVLSDSPQAAGRSDVESVVILRFPDMDAARRSYNSEAYQQALPFRHAAAECRVVLVEGLKESQRSVSERGYGGLRWYITRLSKGNIGMKQASINPAAELSIDEGARQLFRNAMALLGAAVNIVTTDGPGGKAGFAATAICSVTDSPPTLLVCLNQKSSVYETFTANQVLCVNVLAPGHERLAKLFGGKTPQNERFRGASWHPLRTSSPALVNALASFDCRITHSVSVGTHDVLFGRVLDIQISGSRDGLVYFCRDYHRLPTKTDGG